MKPKKIEEFNTGLQAKIPVVKERKLRVYNVENRKIDTELRLRDAQIRANKN